MYPPHPFHLQSPVSDLITPPEASKHQHHHNSANTVTTNVMNGQISPSNDDAAASANTVVIDDPLSSLSPPLAAAATASKPPVIESEFAGTDLFESPEEDISRGFSSVTLDETVEAVHQVRILDKKDSINKNITEIDSIDNSSDKDNALVINYKEIKTSNFTDKTDSIFDNTKHTLYSFQIHPPPHENLLVHV